MNRKTLFISLLLAIFVMTTNAQFSDSDLIITEMYNAEIPTDEGLITLVDGIAGEYELLEYNIMGDLDNNEGQDGTMILVRHGDEGTDYYLYAILSESSFPNPVDWEFLGRDIVILTLNIVEGQIRLEYAAQGEGETIETVLKVWELDDESLSYVYEGALDEGRPFIADEVLSVEELSSISYPRDWFDNTLSFVDGIMSYTGRTSDGTATYTYTLDTENIAYGDLNGDGAEDALVYISLAVEGYEGSSASIAAIMNYHGLPQFIDSYVDRQGSAARLEELAINEDGSITFNFTDLVHQQLLEYTFHLEDGELVFE